MNTTVTSIVDELAVRARLDGAETDDEIRTVIDAMTEDELLVLCKAHGEKVQRAIWIFCGMVTARAPGVFTDAMKRGEK